MIPNKPLIALMTTAMAATFGYAVAQDSSSSSSTDAQYSTSPQPMGAAQGTTNAQTMDPQFANHPEDNGSQAGMQPGEAGPASQSTGTMSTTTSTTDTQSTTTLPGSASTSYQTQTVTIPGRTTGVVPSDPPGTYTAAPGSVEPQSVMTTGVNWGSTRINVGDHATPMLPQPPQVLSVTSQTTTTSQPVAQEETHVAQAETAAAPAPAPAPEPEAAPAPAPAPAPRADRN